MTNPTSTQCGKEIKESHATPTPILWKIKLMRDLRKSEDKRTA